MFLFPAQMRCHPEGSVFFFSSSVAAVHNLTTQHGPLGGLENNSLLLVAKVALSSFQ